MTQIKCSRCGKGVSSLVPDGVILRAWVECPECLEKIPLKDASAKNASLAMDYLLIAVMAFGRDPGSAQAVEDLKNEALDAYKVAIKIQEVGK